MGITPEYRLLDDDEMLAAVLESHAEGLDHHANDPGHVKLIADRLRNVAADVRRPRLSSLRPRPSQDS